MPQTETQIGWQDYLAIVMRRRWYFVVPCAAIVTVAMIVGLFLPKIYRAETLLMVQDQQVINPLMQGLAVSTPVTERLRVLREELLSWTSLSRLVRELGMDRRAKAPVEFERLIRGLQQDIVVGMRGRDLVTISYEHEDPKLAQRLVNSVTAIYMARNVESQSAETETAIGFLDKEMAVYKTKLEDAEHRLREFKELYVMQMPVANELNQQIISLEVSLAQLLVENTEQHPTIVLVKRQIDDLKRQRNNEIKRVIATALVKGADPAIYQDLLHSLEQSGVDTAKDDRQQIARQAYASWVHRMDHPVNAPVDPGTTQIQLVQAEAPDGTATTFGMLGSDATLLSLNPREEQEMVRLTRDYEVYSRTYQSMQERLERAKTTQRLGESDEGTKFKVLEPARLPLRPVRPNFVKLFLFSLLLGLFVGAGAAFVAEYLDQSFQTAEDAQASLALPVLGSISTIVTEDDVAVRNKHRKGWITLKNQLALLKAYVLHPIWARLDRALLRRGL